ncbi:hypothetical protein AMTRI_Chr03g47720 [Amborella trichopoda]
MEQKLPFQLLLLLLCMSAMHGIISQETNEYRISMGEKVEDWFEEEEDERETLQSEGRGRTVVNVESLGAMGDGVTDDTQAFIKAWEEVCSTRNSVFLVPEGRTYLVKAIRFKGPCSGTIIVQIAGKIIAPDEPGEWDPKNPRTWLAFSKLEGVVFQGGGVIDGSGSKWWDSSCKRNKSNPCRSAPTALTIDSSSRVRVEELMLVNSQQIHFTIWRSDAVRVSKMVVQAPDYSPNTDGIHISDSTNVVIQNSKIGTGDDCISIVNGSTNIKMKNIECGPGHGISIGSLGKDNSLAVVSHVVLETATLTGTTNGLRIKTWQGGSGYARAIRFKNVKMNQVSNPIIIDQFYCDSSIPCQNQTSAVNISQVMYINVSGTSKTPNAMKFACSDTVPCSNIILSNVNLQRDNGDGNVQTFCHSAVGYNYGIVHPSADCLRYDTRPHPSPPIHSEL